MCCSLGLSRQFEIHVLSEGNVLEGIGRWARTTNKSTLIFGASTSPKTPTLRSTRNPDLFLHDRPVRLLVKTTER